MRPALRSFLAEISPAWLTAARLRRGIATSPGLDRPTVLRPDALRPPLQAARTQTSPFKPARPSSDIASNM